MLRKVTDFDIRTVLWSYFMQSEIHIVSIIQLLLLKVRLNMKHGNKDPQLYLVEVRDLEEQREVVARQLDVPQQAHPHGQHRGLPDV